ncbi:hypothetical protein C8T65DRAFT_192969 [Cerioporus squamosus]|nr:hypothetical protein C8T65DRAFT_192969 [Cerioporus squamosus]
MDPKFPFSFFCPSPSTSLSQASATEPSPFTSPKTRTQPTAPRRRAKRSKKNREDGPSRPPNPFIIFRSEMSKNKSGQQHLSKFLGHLWTTLSPPEKAVYEARAAAEKEEFYRQKALKRDRASQGEVPTAKRKTRSREEAVVEADVEEGRLGEGWASRPAKRQRCAPLLSTSASSSRSSSTLGSSSAVSTPSTSGGTMLTPTSYGFDGSIVAVPLVQHYQAPLQVQGVVPNPFSAALGQPAAFSYPDWGYSAMVPTYPPSAAHGMHLSQGIPPATTHQPYVRSQAPYEDYDPPKADWENIPLERMVAEETEKIWHPYLPQLDSEWLQAVDETPQQRAGVDGASVDERAWAAPSAPSNVSRQLAGTATSGCSNLSILDEVMAGSGSNSIGSGLSQVMGANGMPVEGGDAELETWFAPYATQSQSGPQDGYAGSQYPC